MTFAKLTIAAALALSALGLAGTATAQGRWDRDHRGWNDRHHGWHNGRHHGWRHNRGYRRCWTVWRHHHRERVCRWVRR